MLCVMAQESENDAYTEAAGHGETVIAEPGQLLIRLDGFGTRSHDSPSTTGLNIQQLF